MLSNGTIGAIAEIQVCADLMKRGYHVFRAISPSCHCDLVAYKTGETLYRIEVKKGQRSRDGSLYLPSFTPEYAERYDILALVDDVGIIRYIPKGIIE